MSFLMVDQEKCTRDGFCVSACPVGIIQMNGGFPESIPEREQWCIQCGHCVAVCPHGALSLDTMPVEECVPLHDNWKQTPEQVGQFLKGRRSVRRYKEQDVERDILAQLIETARYAPSGHNLQPVNWLVIQNPQEVKRFAGLVIEWMESLQEQQAPLAQMLGVGGMIKAWKNGYDPILRGAPHVIVTHARKEDRTAPAACTNALAYLELAALPYKLGTCWAGFLYMATLMYPPAHNALELPENHQCFGAMVVGYPKFEYHRIPLRKDAPITWRP